MRGRDSGPYARVMMSAVMVSGVPGAFFARATGTWEWVGVAAVIVGFWLVGCVVAAVCDWAFNKGGG